MHRYSHQQGAAARTLVALGLDRPLAKLVAALEAMAAILMMVSWELMGICFARRADMLQGRVSGWRLPRSKSARDQIWRRGSRSWNARFLPWFFALTQHLLLAACRPLAEEHSGWAGERGLGR
jgi:hypothetical protein